MQVHRKIVKPYVCVCVCVWCIQGYVYSSASRLIGLELNEDFVRLQHDIVQKYKLSDRVQVSLWTFYIKHKLFLDSYFKLFNFCRFSTLMSAHKRFCWKALMFWSWTMSLSTFWSLANKSGNDTERNIPRIQMCWKTIRGVCACVQSVELHHADLQEERISAGYCSQSAGESECSAGKNQRIIWKPLAVVKTAAVEKKKNLNISSCVHQVVLEPGWVEELPVDYNVYLGRDTDPEALRQIHLYRVLWQHNLRSTNGGGA